MTTSSARPELLREHAGRLRSQADDIDTAVRIVAAQLAAYRDACADGHVAGGALLVARTTEEQVIALARSLMSVASAFEQADRGPAPLQTVPDAALASVLVRMAPALAADPEIGRAMAHERGRRFGTDLAGDSPAEARRRLARLGLTHLDPAFAAGLLAGLGTDGLSRLAVRAQQDAGSYVERPEAEDRLWARLAAVVDAAVHPLDDPSATLRSDPSSLDLGLVARLGRTWQGRLALRNLAAHLHRPPTALTVPLADALLLGPTARDDVMAGWRERATAGVTRPPGTAGEARALGLLAADPVASFRLELLHPGGDSPAILILQRDRALPRRSAAATNLRNVTVVSVQRGWAESWSDPLAGTAEHYQHLPVPRVLNQLIPMVVSVDHVAAVSPALSRALADVVQTHPNLFTVAAAKADVADTDAERTALTGYFTALARDRNALDQTTVTLVEQYRSAIKDSLATHPPGSATTHDVLLDASPSLRPLGLLIDGATEAGRKHHVGVVVATTLGASTANAVLPAVGERYGGPIGGFVGRQAARRVGSATDDYREDHEDTWDGRERDAEEELAQHGPLLGARAMLDDPTWSPRLRFPPAGVTPERLLALDVTGSSADRHAFDRWRDAQIPAVREVLDGLS